MRKTGTEIATFQVNVRKTSSPFSGRTSPIKNNKFCVTYLLTTGVRRIDVNYLTEKQNKEKNDKQMNCKDNNKHINLINTIGFFLL